MNDEWDDQVAPAPDPWARDWSAWSTNLLPDNGFEDEPGDDEPGYGERWRRETWGMRPQEPTFASVAIAVVMPPRRRGAPPRERPWSQVLRWILAGFARNQRPAPAALRLVLVTCILGISVLSGLGAALYAYSDYRLLLNEAKDGTAALTHLGDDLGLGQQQVTKLDAAATEAALNQDLTRALRDFQDIHARLRDPDFILRSAANIPTLRDKLQSGLALSSVAIDAVQLLQSLAPNLASVANVLVASPIATSSEDTQKLLGSADLPALAAAFTRVQPLVAHMVATLTQTPSAILVAALSAQQQRAVVPLLQGVPQLPTILRIAAEFLSLKSAPDLLGITKPVAYLLMTLDNTEIRPVGGFQGQ